MRCVSFCTARSYNLTAAANHYKNTPFHVRLYRNVLHISQPAANKDIFCFTNGCLVCWGLTKREENQLIIDFKSFSTSPLDKIETDRFIYKLGDDTKIQVHEKFNVDMITLETNSTALKLAISYGLAQSIKLEAYEEAITKTTAKNEALSEELALTGKISLSRIDISKRMGEIFIDRSSINLKSEYLDIPEYFWKYPSLESYYVKVEKYLDVPRRVAALNHKLDVLHELFDMLTSQLQHRHSSLLESIIIILILVEIILSFFH